MTSTTKQLAEFALDLKLESLPSEVVEAAHIRILDTIGVAIPGAREQCSQIAYNVGSLGGGDAGHCTIIGGHRRATAEQAALINGISSHALEFDDMTSSIVSHTSASVVPSTFALSEELNLSGRELLEAYIVGFEVTSRVGWSMRFNLLKHGWHPNGVLAVIGCAAAGARSLGSTLDQVRAAIGIAASCSSGIRKNVGSMTKPFHMGHAASNGILAAKLARSGFSADLDILDREPPTGGHARHADFSFPEVFVGEEDYDLSQVVDGLGERYELAENTTVTRFHPGSSYPQAAIDEVLMLVNKHKIDHNEITKLRVGVSPTCMTIASYDFPSTAFDARFSLRYAIAAAAVDREVTLRQYTEVRVARGDLQDFINRIEVYVHPELAAVSSVWTGDGLTPISCRIEIHGKGDQRYSGARNTTIGYPGTKVTWEDVLGKYRDCAQGVMNEAQVESSAKLIRDLTVVPKISDLGVLLASEQN